MTGPLILLLIACAVLIGGTELLVRGAVRLARPYPRLHTPVVMAAMISGGIAPVVFVTAMTAAGGSPDIAFGTLAGAVMFFTLGLTGLLAFLRPQAAGRAIALRTGGALTGALALFAALTFDGNFVQAEAALLLLAMALIIIFGRRKSAHHLHIPDTPEPCSGWCASAFVLIGIALLMTGADILTDAAAALIPLLQLTDGQAGMTLFALGASLPAALATIVTGLRSEHVGLPNLLVSMLFLVLASGGFMALLQPLPVPAFITDGAALTMVGSALLLTALTALKGYLNRLEGLLLLALYTGWLLYVL